MTRLLFAMLMIGGLGCAVDAGPQPSGPQTSQLPDDETSETTPAPAAAITPHFVQCGDEVCELRAGCIADGGRPGAPCTSNGAVCCSFD
jgi:hypothetical protein